MRGWFFMPAIHGGLGRTLRQPETSPVGVVVIPRPYSCQDGGGVRGVSAVSDEELAEVLAQAREATGGEIGQLLDLLNTALEGPTPG